MVSDAPDNLECQYSPKDHIDRDKRKVKTVLKHQDDRKPIEASSVGEVQAAKVRKTPGSATGQ